MRWKDPCIGGLACVLATMIAAGLGCEEAGRPGSGDVHAWEVRIAHLWAYDGEAVQVPDSVQAGQPFDILLLSALSGCDVKGPDDVQHLSDSTIEIIPQDSMFVGNAMCPAWIHPARHQITLEFPHPGEAQILVTANTFTGHGLDSLVTLEKRVVVE
jgi:hypothetical protein